MTSFSLRSENGLTKQVSLDCTALEGPGMCVSTNTNSCRGFAEPCGHAGHHKLRQWHNIQVYAPVDLLALQGAHTCCHRRFSGEVAEHAAVAGPVLATKEPGCVDVTTNVRLLCESAGWWCARRCRAKTATVTGIGLDLVLLAL